MTIVGLFKVSLTTVRPEPVEGQASPSYNAALLFPIPNPKWREAEPQTVL
jgi:hypothetical protein